MSDQKEYLVTWQIEVYADTPEDAARQALAIQRDSGSLATCFTVAEKTPDGDLFIEDETFVDLEEECSGVVH